MLAFSVRPNHKKSATPPCDGVFFSHAAGRAPRPARTCSVRSGGGGGGTGEGRREAQCGSSVDVRLGGWGWLTWTPPLKKNWGLMKLSPMEDFGLGPVELFGGSPGPQSPLWDPDLFSALPPFCWVKGRKKELALWGSRLGTTGFTVQGTRMSSCNQWILRSFFAFLVVGGRVRIP